MSNNTRLLVLVSIIAVISGFSFLWFGLRPVSLENNPTLSPAPILESTESSDSAAVSGAESQKVLVTKVIDGDTIEVESEITIRFIGIDTPETKDPRRAVGCFGKEASNKTESLLNGQTIILEKDVSETD